MANTVRLIENTTALTTASKKKYLRIKLTKAANELYNEDF